jgi:hypothetical protein
MSSEKGELPTWYALDHAPSDKGEANPTPGPHGPQLEPGDAQNIVLGAALLTQTAPPKPEPKQDEIPEDEVPKPKSEVWTEIGSDSNCFSPPGDTSQPVPVPAIIGCCWSSRRHWRKGLGWRSARRSFNRIANRICSRILG